MLFQIWVFYIVNSSSSTSSSTSSNSSVVVVDIMNYDIILCGTVNIMK